MDLIFLKPHTECQRLFACIANETIRLNAKGVWSFLYLFLSTFSWAPGIFMQSFKSGISRTSGAHMDKRHSSNQLQTQWLINFGKRHVTFYVG